MDAKYGQFFFFGDREYPTIKRIFATTEEHPDNVPYLSWDVMLCSHHCSKAVMHWQEEEDDDEVFKQDIMDYFNNIRGKGRGTSCPVRTRILRMNPATFPRTKKPAEPTRRS